jgi:hypothetical protein
MASSASEVGRRIDAGMRRALRNRNADAYAMRERAQLLERFAALDRGRLEPRELLQ